MENFHILRRQLMGTRRVGVGGEPFCLQRLQRFGRCPVRAIARASDVIHQITLVVGEDLEWKMDVAPLDAELAIIFGGDGTMLAAARLLAPLGVPAVGINLGKLGFLAEVQPDEFRPAIDKVLAGDGVVSKRMMLSARVRGEGREPRQFIGLNDVVVSRQALSPIARLEIAVDGEHLTVLSGNGLIVATPTGSTAYNLSAGGPILSGAVEGIILTPVCAHMLSLRPLVISGDETVEIRLPDGEEPVGITVDGRVHDSIRAGDTVTVKRSEHVFKLIRLPDGGPYGVMREKLHWGRPALEDR